MHLNTMAPLAVSDPKEFCAHLDYIASVNPGSAISVDVWRGQVEVAPFTYQFDYYDRLFDAITSRGLQVIMIISLHACGGNVGDTVDIPLPKHIWQDLSRKTGLDACQSMCIAENGFVSPGFVSPWLTGLALEGYKAFFDAVASHFAIRAKQIAQIVISTGEAGELRYPSYGVPDFGFSKRGALQCYSQPAFQSFREDALRRFGGLSGVQEAWGWRGTTSEITPPSNPNEFFGRFDHVNTVYGRAFFDWYSNSLLSSGYQILMTAIQSFNASQSAFRGFPMGVKIPGIHWRVGRLIGNTVEFQDRLAESTAGLVRPGDSDLYDTTGGFGYTRLLTMLAKVKRHYSMLNVIFTCAEMSDGPVWYEDGTKPGVTVDCLPFTLLSSFAAKARELGLEVEGENALNSTLSEWHSWETMTEHLVSGRLSGLTVLRASDVATDPVARRSYALLSAKIAAYNRQHLLNQQRQAERLSYV